MRLTIKVEQVADGRWFAEAAELAWVVGHGITREEAICRAEQLAIEEIAERVSRGELDPSAFDLTFEVARPSITPPAGRLFAFLTRSAG
jgi:predicted RNase H-like HicB family nuclease